MATTINQIIPKMTDQKFRSNLKAIGVLGYDIISDSSIIIYGSTKSRSDKKQALIELAELLKPYSARFFAGRTSDDGYVSIGSVKVMLRPEKAAGGLNLSPKFFGTNITKIVDKSIPFGSYSSSVINAINTTSKLTDIQKELLLALVEEAGSGSQEAKTKVKNIMKNIGQTLPISSINNDFAEVLGPLAIISRGLLPIQGSAATVRLARNSEDPLMDYKITDGSSEYKISTRSSRSTNITEPEDVVVQIEKSGMTEQNFYYNKWFKTPQYKVLKILQHGTVNKGPIDAAIWLRDNGYANYFSWLKNAEYSDEVRQRCEDLLVELSSQALDFTDIFRDATKTKVYCVNFTLSLTGEMQWNLVENAQDRREKRKTERRITLISNNTANRAKDKLGFNV